MHYLPPTLRIETLKVGPSNSCLTITGCYGLNVSFIFICCWSSNPQSDGIWRWGLWEVMKVGLSWMGLVPLYWDRWKMMCLCVCVCTHTRACTHMSWKVTASRQLCVRELSQEMEFAGTLLLDFLASKKLNVCYLSHPVMVFCCSSPNCLRHKAPSDSDAH